ncbi:hypothetical protein GO621_09455 [Mucilaginibacter sp. HMF7410]|uniref:Uncharacterized protein n=1 Tax=Mucilaginibacter arboris TaxID=2682090 RepID=A0A7K1SWR2_9SPHI|nr:hypothetical protein [Mucilaginibacter arboris]MVN21762.1 hypothetical protein [Mucilaginibacter arboris]
MKANHNYCTPLNKFDTVGLNISNSKNESKSQHAYWVDSSYLVGLNISNSKNESKSQLVGVLYKKTTCWVKYQ